MVPRQAAHKVLEAEDEEAQNQVPVAGALLHAAWCQPKSRR
jgi:hypothetical protein